MARHDERSTISQGTVHHHRYANATTAACRCSREPSTSGRTEGVYRTDVARRAANAGPVVVRLASKSLHPNRSRCTLGTVRILLPFIGNVQPLTIPDSRAPLRHWKAVAERRRHFRAGCLKQQLETGAATEQLARRTRATKRWRRAGLRRDDRERTLRFDHRRVIDTNIHTPPHQLFAPNSEVRQGSSRRHPRKLSPSQTHDPETTDAGRSVMFPMDRSNLVTRDESSGNAIAWRRSRLSISC
jgi:hypothetical protein